MIIESSGYSAGFEQERLRLSAMKVGRALGKLFKKHDTNVVVVTGNSGVSMGYAVLAHCKGLDMRLVIVRKDNDGSHGRKFEGPSGLVFSSYILMDDLIDTGSTVRRVHNDFAKHCNRRHQDVPTMAAIVVYAQRFSRVGEVMITDNGSDILIPVTSV